MKQYPSPYFTNSKIRESIYKVASVRSLTWNQFIKQLEILMNDCYDAGFDEGRNFNIDSYPPDW